MAHTSDETRWCNDRIVSSMDRKIFTARKKIENLKGEIKGLTAAKKAYLRTMKKGIARD